MKIANLVVLLVIYASCFVNCKRQKPRHDEIERVLNDTRSYIWKCSLVECPPGYGLNVPCGSSIPFNVSIHCVLCDKGISYSDAHDFSQCKTCTNCDPHEERSGWCGLEKDTIKCLRTCHKGFYWDNLTDSCHPCSKCCNKNNTSHEKQCEGSGLPITHQCQQTNIICPTDPTDSLSGNNALGSQDQSSMDLEQQTLSSLEIGAITISTILLIIIILVITVLVWMWRKLGWQRTKTKLENCFCFCCSETSIGRNTVSVHFDNTSREEEAKKGSLQSGPPVGKRPDFLRLFSVPLFQSQSKVKPAIPRSHSHPGCLKDLAKEPAGDMPGSPKKCGNDRRTKKFGKKMYVSVATFDQDHERPDVIDHNAAGAGNPELTIIRAEPELIITNQDQADHEERDEKPSMTKLSPLSFPVKTQSTSTTGLHYLSSTNISSVPEDFQTHLLSRKMTAIPFEFYHRICVKLDTSRGCLGDDNRLFGDKIGLSHDEILCLGQQQGTTHSMIQKFNSQRGNTIKKFKEILTSMGRYDVVSVIDEWIVYKWNTRCSSSAVYII